MNDLAFNLGESLIDINNKMKLFGIYKEKETAAIETNTAETSNRTTSS